MLVSIVIPACEAHDTIAGAVRSLIVQSAVSWEAIVVSDDGSDYRPTLEAAGIRDDRLVFVSTGAVRSGCHNARNVGLRAVRGEVIAALDADDAYHPDRLKALVPPALAYGAAVDNTAAVDDDTGRHLHSALDPIASEAARDSGKTRIELTIARLLKTSVPLSAVVRRDCAEPRLPGIEFGEDVVANLRLIDRLGSLPMLTAPTYTYRVRSGSICHSDDSAGRADDGYRELLRRLRDPQDGLGLSPAGRQAAIRGIETKRALNHAFDRARRTHPGLNFQTFVAGYHIPTPALGLRPC